MWLTSFREKYGLDIDELGALLRRAGKKKKPELYVSNELLYRLEVDRNFKTIPKLANLIAEACGATAKQRDELVLKERRGTWYPPHRKKGDAPPVISMMRQAAPRADAAREIITPTKPVVTVDRTGQSISRFSSVNHASLMLGVHKETISRRCHRNVSGDEFAKMGYTFRFADEYDRMTPRERIQDVAPRDICSTNYGRRGSGGVRHGYAVTAIDRGGNAVHYDCAKSAAEAAGIAPSTVTVRLREGNGIAPDFFRGRRYILTSIWRGMSERERRELRRED